MSRHQAHEAYRKTAHYRRHLAVDSTYDMCSIPELALANNVRVSKALLDLESHRFVTKPFPIEVVVASAVWLVGGGR